MNLFPSKDKKIELLARLRLLGVTEVRVEFSGGGDSGEVSHIQTTSPQGEIDTSKEEMNWPDTVSTRKDDEWVSVTIEKTMTLHDVIEKITYSWLESTSLDWYNNEGGQGHMTIDFTQSPPKFDMYVGVNIMETEDHEFEANEEDDWGVA
jgi:hypothetical protein